MSPCSCNCCSGDCNSCSCSSCGVCQPPTRRLIICKAPFIYCSVHDILKQLMPIALSNHFPRSPTSSPPVTLRLPFNYVIPHRTSTPSKREPSLVNRFPTKRQKTKRSPTLDSRPRIRKKLFKSMLKGGIFEDGGAIDKVYTDFSRGYY